MITYQIQFSDRDTLPDFLECHAKELILTVEMLIKRFIVAGVQQVEKLEGPVESSPDWNDVWMKSEVLTPK